MNFEGGVAVRVALVGWDSHYGFQWESKKAVARFYPENFGYGQAKAAAEFDELVIYRLTRGQPIKG